MRIVRTVNRPRHVAAALLVISGATLGASGTAFAERAAGPASCAGHEASNISPPGSSEEVAGGMPELMQFIREAVPGPPGGFVSYVARLHEGSHEACDEVLE